MVQRRGGEALYPKGNQVIDGFRRALEDQAKTFMSHVLGSSTDSDSGIDSQPSPLPRHVMMEQLKAAVDTHMTQLGQEGPAAARQRLEAALTMILFTSTTCPEIWSDY